MSWNVLNHSKTGDAVPCLCEVASKSCEILQMKQVTAADQQFHDVSLTLLAVPSVSVWSVIHTRSSKVPAGIGVWSMAWWEFSHFAPLGFQARCVQLQQKQRKPSRTCAEGLASPTFHMLRLAGRGSRELFSSTNTQVNVNVKLDLPVLWMNVSSWSWEMN